MFYRRIREALVSKILEHENKIAQDEWRDVSLLSADRVGEQISAAIGSKTAYLSGKVGANEQVLLQWAMGLRVRGRFHSRSIAFSQTRKMLSGAGLKPRSKESYFQFVPKLTKSIQDADILGIWKYAGERDIYRKVGTNAQLCDFFDLDPWFMDKPWSSQLEGKTVYVVSPFLNTFREQMPKARMIWGGRPVLPELNLTGYKFPFLMSEDSAGDWRDVLWEVIEDIDRAQPDVVLTGCGALGFPIACHAKRRGKVGIHMGGMLQLLFGVKGKRYEQAARYKPLLNEAWVPPPSSERPSDYRNVEDGCYW